MSHNVRVKPSNHEFDVNPNESILDASLRAGLVFPYGCRSGSCGACKGKILEGRIRYPEPLPSGLENLNTADGEALFCQAVPETDLLVEVREIERPAEVETKRLPCRVVKMEKLAPDVMQLFIKLPENERLQFMAGQYIDFLLRDGRRRSFSLANPPHDDALLELHVRHVPGGEFTDYVFNKMKEKDLLRLEGPLGTFFLREDSEKPMILLAGGTGFAPIKALILHTLARGSQRPMYFYWGARAREDLYQNDVAEEWADQHSHIKYIPVLSDPRPEDNWSGRTGFVHQAVLEDFSDLSGYEVYACGPPPMINAARAEFCAGGLPEDGFFADAFEFAPDSQKS